MRVESSACRARRARSAIAQPRAGTRIELTTDNGLSGDDYAQTIFDDAAATSVTAGSAPFSGTFKPEQALSSFDGQNANGTWHLEIYDDVAMDTGTLDGWSITIN